MKHTLVRDELEVVLLFDLMFGYNVRNILITSERWLLFPPLFITTKVYGSQHKVKQSNKFTTILSKANGRAIAIGLVAFHQQTTRMAWLMTMLPKLANNMVLS